MGNDYRHTRFIVTGGSQAKKQAVLWSDTGTDSWAARMPLPDTEFELLLTVQPGDGGRYVAQIEKVDLKGVFSTQVLLRFYDELLPFVFFEAIQECTNKALEIAANSKENGNS